WPISFPVALLFSLF
ncbi:TPA: GhoT/OrtT family toxin, partial [Salmonella enterica subsp. enterica serovar Oranienburg]|nr:GhoT/OrtT family toxin [Salmonella enterica subsp. enterica serovar Oranienburg]